jgi:hypothetical protein
MGGATATGSNGCSQTILTIAVGPTNRLHHAFRDVAGHAPLAEPVL